MPDHHIRFDDRVVVITGAGHGLGRSYALEMGARGAKVVVNDLGGSPFGEGADTRPAEEVAEAIRSAGGDAVADYHSVNEGNAIIETALSNFGRIDVLVNNAGILRDKSFHKMSEADWDIIFDVHVKGVFKTTHAAWPLMREQGFGRLVFTTSGAGIYGNHGQANYSAAKLAQLGLANTLAVEGRSKNILVNTIAPVAGSRLTETVMSARLVEGLKPDLVMPLVLKLCDEHSTETGGLFEVGAGWISKHRFERTRGVRFSATDGFTPEDVLERWEKLCDFTDTEHPKSIADATSPAIENLKRSS